MLAETLFAHYRMPEDGVTHIAKGNAAVNLCLAHNAIDKNIAYAYSTVSAQLLDISVFDRDFYKTSYQRSMDELKPALERSNAQSECGKLEKMLPELTQKQADFLMRLSSNLAVARAQERQQIATTLTRFGNNLNQQNYAATYGWPRVTYVEAEAQPASTNYLVNTSKGLIQCRSTNKNYVFCM